MGWNKLKIVLIGVLVAFNLFLLYMIREQARQSEYLPDESVAQIVTLLEKDGITLADGALDPKKKSLVIYGGELGGEYYADTASRVSGSDVSLSFPTPSGVVLSMENGDRCTFDGGFRIRYEASGFTELLEAYDFLTGDPAAFADSGIFAILSAREERALADTVEAFLLEAGGIAERGAPHPVQLTPLFYGADPETKVQYFVAVQTVEGIAVTNLCSAFAVLDGTVVGMSGEWSFAEIQSAYSAQLYDQINILYNVKERITAERSTESTVLTSVSLVYAVYYHADASSFYMIPTWNVSTDAGKNYLLNGVDGTFYTD